MDRFERVRFLERRRFVIRESGDGGFVVRAGGIAVGWFPSYREASDECWRMSVALAHQRLDYLDAAEQVASRAC